MQTTNDLDNIDPISTMILATVTVGDAYDDPMTAEDIAFCLDTALRTVKSKLKRLTKAGIIEMHGEGFDTTRRAGSRQMSSAGWTPSNAHTMSCTLPWKS